MYKFVEVPETLAYDAMGLFELGFYDEKLSTIPDEELNGEDEESPLKSEKKDEKKEVKEDLKVNV